MSDTHLTLLTIVIEADLIDRLTADLARIGVRGWNTVGGEAVWRGARSGPGPVDLAGPTVRIETVCTRAVAAQVMARLKEAYFPHFSVLAWITEAEVMRPAKFRD
jgi:hypothetical protein